jgi:integrase
MGVFARKRKGKKVYYIGFQWQKRQQQELVGTDKAAARRLLAQRAREVAAGTYSPQHKTGAVKAAQYAHTWGEARTNITAADDRTRLRLHFVPYLGDMKIEDIRPRDIIAWVKRLRAESNLEAKAIINVYGTVRTMFKHAVIDELIAATPCVLPENVLPPKPSKEPGIYEKAAVLKLITDERVPLDRRVFYALAFLTGMRHGELAGRRWKDWDRDAEPLTALHVRTQYNDQPLKSPDGKLRPRTVPVHPLLAEMLTAWRDEGFPRQFGRKPEPEDFLVPSRRGPRAHRTVRRSLTNLVERDCPAVGVEPLTFHRTRDTFVSLCRRAGAPKDVVERITHNASGSVIDSYTHLDWTPLCAAVLLVQLPLAAGPALPPAGPSAPAGSMLRFMSPSEGDSESSNETASDVAGRTGLEHIPTARQGAETTGNERKRTPKKTSLSAEKPRVAKKHDARHTADDLADAIGEDRARADAYAALTERAASLPVRGRQSPPSRKGVSRG